MRFVWTKAVSFGPEEDALVQHDAAPAARLQAVDHVLEEQDLRRPGLVGEAGLGLLAFLASERRVHQDHVEQRRRVSEEPAVRFLAGQDVPVPDVGLVDVVEDQVGERDRVDRVVLLAAVERAAPEGLEPVRYGTVRIGSGGGRRPRVTPETISLTLSKLTTGHFFEAENREANTALRRASTV